MRIDASMFACFFFPCDNMYYYFQEFTSINITRVIVYVTNHMLRLHI